MFVQHQHVDTFSFFSWHCWHPCVTFDSSLVTWHKWEGYWYVWPSMIKPVKTCRWYKSLKCCQKEEERTRAVVKDNDPCRPLNDPEPWMTPTDSRLTFEPIIVVQGLKLVHMQKAHDHATYYSWSYNDLSELVLLRIPWSGLLRCHSVWLSNKALALGVSMSSQLSPKPTRWIQNRLYM